jgi:Ca-activated chloride channel family protein
MKYLRGKRATYFGNLKTLERTHGYKVFHISILVLVFKMILIILLYMVATNSILVRDYQPITDTDYVLLIDDSSSMANSDYQPNRLASAKEIAVKWIDILPNSTKVSIVAFSRNIDHSTPLTHDTDELLDTIDDIQIDYTKSGTDVDFAINYALDLLSASENNKTILLMTDGTQGASNDTLQKANLENVRIVVFGIGDASIRQTADVPQELIGSFSDLSFNNTQLELIAQSTGGESYEVSDEIELEQSFNEATLKEVQISLDSGYYVTLIIAIMSIFELLIYARLGAL